MFLGEAKLFNPRGLLTRKRFTGWNFAEARIQIPSSLSRLQVTIRSSIYSSFVHARELLVRVMV